MTDFPLPLSLEELRAYLSQELSRLELRAREAEQDMARRRLAVMEEFEGPLRQQSARLQALGLHDEAQRALQLVDAVARESSRLSGRLAPVAASAPSQLQAAAELPDPALPVTAHEQEVGEMIQGASSSLPAQDDDQNVEPVAEGADVRPPSGAAEVELGEAAAGVSPSGISEEARAQVDDLFSRMEMLSAAAPDMDHEELKLRIEILGATGRVLQSDYPLLRGQNTRYGDRLYCMFGGLTTLAKTYLNPCKIFVDSVSQKKSHNWQRFLERCEGQLTELLDRREADRKRKEDEDLAVRRRKQAADQNSRQAALAREDVLELASYPSDMQDSYWQEDLRDAVRDFHRWSPNQIDESLLSVLRDHGSLFKNGGEFRWLRRKVNPKASESGPFEPVDADLGTARQSVQTNTRAFDQWRGYLEGRRAAIVGASCRENRREQLQKFFGLSSLEWIENERTEAANTHTLDQRIRNGRYDVVFYLARFSSHSLQDCAKSACKQSDVPFLVIERGYGIGAFCRAMDRARGLFSAETAGA